MTSRRLATLVWYAVPWLTPLIACGLFVFLAFQLGTLIADQQQVLDRLESESRARSDEMHSLREEIREEIRTPAGERAATHEAAREAIEATRRIEAALEEILARLEEP